MKHNVYAYGKFQNIEFTDSESDKSIGIIEAGSYDFTTEHEETVQCLTGQITTTGANEKFTISAEETSTYLCSYK